MNACLSDTLRCLDSQRCILVYLVVLLSVPLAATANYCIMNNHQWGTKVCSMCSLFTSFIYVISHCNIPYFLQSLLQPQIGNKEISIITIPLLLHMMFSSSLLQFFPFVYLDKICLFVSRFTFNSYMISKL